MNFHIRYVYEAIDKFSAQARKMNKHVKAMTKNFEKFGAKMKSIGQSMTKWVSLPIAGLGALAIRSAAKMETMETAFIGILGSSEKAKNMVAELNDFTAKTPFQLEQVSAAAKQLLAANVGPESIKESLQTLGDISAAANIPLTDMSAIFSKIKNKGKAMTEEILQMSDRGIPVIDVLAKQFGVAKDQVFEFASKGKIKIDDINKAFETMTAQGGFAHKAMILQSKTLSGVFSTLKDNVGLALAEVGKSFLPLVKAVALKITDMAQGIAKFAKENPGMVKILGVLGGVLAVVGPLLVGLAALGAIAPAIGVGFSIMFGPIGLIVAAIAALTAGVIWLVSNWDRLTNSLADKTWFQGLVATFDAIGTAVKFVIRLFTSLESKFAAVSGAFKAAGSLIGLGGGVAMQQAKMAGKSQKVDLNGNINIAGNTEAVKSGSLAMSGASGNLGLNIAGAPAGG